MSFGICSKALHCPIALPIPWGVRRLRPDAKAWHLAPEGLRPSASTSKRVWRGVTSRARSDWACSASTMARHRWAAEGGWPSRWGVDSIGAPSLGYLIDGIWRIDCLPGSGRVLPLPSADARVVSTRQSPLTLVLSPGGRGGDASVVPTRRGSLSMTRKGAPT